MKKKARESARSTSTDATNHSSSCSCDEIREVVEVQNNLFIIEFATIHPNEFNNSGTNCRPDKQKTQYIMKSVNEHMELGSSKNVLNAFFNRVDLKINQLT
uniref:Uncharacterized protein n=1 Tax=Caenorhabditis tropicalis TaxID=1561998 RepID=A0A1I7T599_9PELO